MGEPSINLGMIKPLFKTIRKWFTRPVATPTPVDPKGVRVVRHDKLRGILTFVYNDETEITVCDFCLGNCGQCGTSVGMGIAPQMGAMVMNLEGGIEVKPQYRE